MSTSETYLFKNCAEYVPLAEIKTHISRNIRGVYVLYDSPDGNEMNVVYIGMSRGKIVGVGARLEDHKKNKPDLWTHFSVYEVWDNITEAQVEELEGFFRHVYARDTKSQGLSKSKTYDLLTRIRRKPGQWLTTRFANDVGSSQTLPKGEEPKKPLRKRRTVNRKPSASSQPS
jgi:hypothetical protein